MKVDVKFGKETVVIEVPDGATVTDLKQALHARTGVSPSMQKLTGKPNLNREDVGPQTLASVGIKDGTKLMLIGSSATEVVEANAAPAAEATKREKTLRSFPVPFWVLPPFAGLMADPYSEGKIEGGTAPLALVVADLVLSRVNTLGVNATLLRHLSVSGAAAHPLLPTFTTEDRTRLARAHGVLRKAVPFAELASSITKMEEVGKAVDAAIALVVAAPIGEWVLIPGGWIGMQSRCTMYYLVTKQPPTAAAKGDDVYSLVVVNTGAGLEYHAALPGSEKVKYQTSTRLDGINKARMCDKGWWLLMLSMWMKSNDPNIVSEYNRAEIIYDVLLPWLVEEGDAALGKASMSPRLLAGMMATGAKSQQQLVAATATATAATSATEAATGSFDTPQRSESSATKALFAALFFVLRDLGMATPALKQLSFALRYETFLKAAEELRLAAQRCDPTPALTRGISSLGACGVDPKEFNIGIDALFDALGPKEFVKTPQNVIIPREAFRGKVVGIYFSGAWCTACKGVTPLLVEAATALKKQSQQLQRVSPQSSAQGKAIAGNPVAARIAAVSAAAAAAAPPPAPGFEIVWISCDRSQEEHDEHAATLPFGRVSFPCRSAIEAFNITSIPKLLLFGPDGLLLTDKGVEALQIDPEAKLFPRAPWTGASAFTATDRAMLDISAGQLAHDSVKKHRKGLVTDAVLNKVHDLVVAVKSTAAAMPTTLKITTPTSGENASQQQQDAEPVVSTLLPDAPWPLCELLPEASTVRYEGARYDSKLPPLGDLSVFKAPTTLNGLGVMLGLAVTTTEQLWHRARFSGTSSRVAVQMQIVEFITWLFTSIIPIPAPPSATTPCLYRDAFNEPPAPPGASAGAAAAGGATGGADAAPPLPAGETGPMAGDHQLTMCRQVYSLLLSLSTAWQSVEVPTRAFDSERGLVAAAILCVYDAVARNTNGSKKGLALAFLLNDDGGYFLSTTVCKATKKFEEVSSFMELNRPHLLPIRSAALMYMSAMERRCRNELFDFRMPDKFEVRKHSHTVNFLRRFLENCGYQINARPQNPMMGPPSEMETLMGWLCDERNPMAREHPEFFMLRDVVLLYKWLVTMEMRDAHLLRKKKQLDEFATWRISFDEDGPGRQMSAGWRTKPRPPAWGLLMVRGRDMDIADVEVKGFGERELGYGDGLVLHSPVDVAALVNIEAPTEDDLLHAKTLPTFGNVVSEEESEVLLSALTVPYLRIPLVLDFFSTQDRHTYLFAGQMQAVLRAALFEPGPFLPPSALSASPREVANVPMRLTALQRKEVALRQLRSATADKDDTLLLGTECGLLLSELTHSPAGVLIPLARILATVAELGPSSVYSSNANYVLFLTQLVSDVLRFTEFAAERNSQSGAATAAGAELEGHRARLAEMLGALVGPLLAGWMKEAEDNADTPTLCVVHTFAALLHRALLRSGATLSHTDFCALLASCAFVRARHGFGMGMLRTQLAQQQGDAELSAEERLLRFLQAQGLDTGRVTTEQLEHGRRLMMAGGRRRAVFVHVVSRYHSDTVRVPNLQRTDPASTAEAKALRLPPIDVPEHELFALLQENHGAFQGYLRQCEAGRLSGLLSHIVRVVLRDADPGAPAIEAADATAADSAVAAAATERWALSGPGVYTAPVSGLVFHLQTCELFWRDDELKPVPDSMSHFSDYETILGKDVLQCGAVARTVHKHWVHVVGTSYDLIEWTPHDPKDQGVHQPSVLRARKPPGEEEDDDDDGAGGDAGAPGAVPGMPNVTSGARGRGGSDRTNRGGAAAGGRGGGAAARGRGGAAGRGGARRPPPPQGGFRSMFGGPPAAESAGDVVDECEFDGVVFSRPLDVEEQAPWPVLSERWAVTAVRAVFAAMYPMPGECKYQPLMQALSPADTLAAAAAASVAPPASEAPGAPGCCDVVRLLANDELQYEDEQDRLTWKEIVVRKHPEVHVLIFNLVPHSRVLYRSLVFASNQRLALHTLMPIKSPRSKDTMELLRYQAGEPKRRVQHEGSLRIVRSNPALGGGRETYLPPRLLQGLIPSALLENFLFWHGSDDIIRGVPLGSHPWFLYNIELHLQPQRKRAGTSDIVGIAGIARIVRRHDDTFTPIVDAKGRTAGRTGAVGSGSGSGTGAASSGSGAATGLGLLNRGESAASYGHDAAAVEALRQAFPNVPAAAARLALQRTRGSATRAGEWLADSRNMAIIEACRPAELPVASPTCRAASDAADGMGVATASNSADGSPMRERTGSGAHLPSSGSCDSLHAGGEDEGAEVERAASADLVLMNVFAGVASDDTAGRSLQWYTTLFPRLEDASHTLFWGRPVEADPSVAASAAAAPAMPRPEGEDPHASLELHIVELPRLRAKFQPRFDGHGVTRLFLVDHPGWHVAPPDVAAPLAALTEPFEQALVLQGAAMGEIALLLPSHEFSALRVRGDPFSRLLAYDRGSLSWQESVPSAFYIVPVHPSRGMLQPPSLACSLYLAALLTARQCHGRAMLLAESCYVDTAFTVEEQFVCSLFERTLDPNAPDNHPDAHAVRLKIAHALLYSPNKLRWPLHVELEKYLAKLPHVSGNCRLRHDEVLDLLKRSARAGASIRSQLEFARGMTQGKPTVELRVPAAQKAGQPWLKLLATSHARLSNGPKLTRVHYVAPTKPFRDEELVKLLWEDNLMADEESGTSRQLGWLFLYLLHRRRLVLALGDADVTGSLTTLLTRSFHLRHNMWGREATGAGEVEAVPSQAMGVLAAMSACPLISAWPDLTDRAAFGLLHQGVNVASHEASETALPTFMRGVTDALRTAHNGPMRVVGLTATSLLGSVDADRVVSVPAVRPQSFYLPRPAPSDTGLGSVSLKPGSAVGFDATTIVAFATIPFAGLGLERYIAVHAAAGAEHPTVPSTLPFDVSQHPATRPPIAADMLRRLQADMAYYAAQVNNATVRTLACVDKEVLAMLCDDHAPASLDLEALDARIAGVQQALSGLADALVSLHRQDGAVAADAAAEALRLTNDLAPAFRVGGSSRTTDVVRHCLLREKGTTSVATLEWICGALLSTACAADLARVNPFSGPVEAIVANTLSVMLHTVRQYFASQALLQTKALAQFISSCYQRCVARFTTAAGDPRTDEGRTRGMSRLGSFLATGEAGPDSDATRQRLEQLCATLVDTLTAQRHYVESAGGDGSPAKEANADGTPPTFTLDPRFLAFEFIFSIMLRRRQVEMVRWFVDNARGGRSRVQQMIMGQGKTTVVGPLLTLVLADGRTLVTQVMPTALLEQSRNVLRRCFSVVIPKHVVTLQFDRSFDDSADAVHVLFQKLRAARDRRAVVVAAPECLKALFLKFVEQLHATELVPTSAIGFFSAPRRQREAQLLRDKTVARAAMADALVPIFHLWRDGVLIMDEVDVLLHPLRSELNFPIGHKQPLELFGPRWYFPIFLIDAVFHHRRGAWADDVASRPVSSAVTAAGSPGSPEWDHLEKARLLAHIDSVIARGYQRRALQREPHLVLLDPTFYMSELRPALVQWSIHWLRRHCPGARAAALHDHVPDRVFIEYLTLPEVHQMRDTICGNFIPAAIQLLNLARDWLGTLLPHCLGKINRVGYGLLLPENIAALVGGTGDSATHVPLSRRLMAVPFVAKDVPSRSSEFAHPDVVIGLTILAFRYESLRIADVKAVLTQLRQDYARQTGPREHRPASILYNRWLALAGAAATHQQHQQKHGNHPQQPRSPLAPGSPVGFGGGGATVGAVPLSQLQLLDPAHMNALHSILCRIPETIHHYLCQHVFPRTMNFQQLKVSACGHELGSSILFSTRIGFSGTPSNLLPQDLGECSYEPGSDGRIVSVLTDPQVTTAEKLPDDWTPRLLLERIAAAQPPYHALIDTGALITNMTNESVARFLAERLPASFEGVVFLDDRDRQCVLLRGSGLVVPLSQCGVALTRRFTFFDQIHTTGMDIKQSPTATAVVTIGKDMVLRDYAQGCYRMRGIGKGQRIRLFLIPEVAGRIADALGAPVLGSNGSSSAAAPPPEGEDAAASPPLCLATGRPEVDVPAWLLLNAMRAEGLQSVKLLQQELANVYRKEGLHCLVADTEQHAALQDDDDSVANGTLQQNSVAGAGGEQQGAGAVARAALDALSASHPTTRHVDCSVVPAVVVAKTAASCQTPWQRSRRFATDGDAATAAARREQRAAIEEFREHIAFPVSGSVETPVPFVASLRATVDARTAAAAAGTAPGLSARGAALVAHIVGCVARTVDAHGAGVAAEAGMGLHAEVVHEQEAEEEQQQEAEQEEQRVSAFSRDDEQHIPWHVGALARPPPEASVSDDSCFYPCAVLRVRPEQPRVAGVPGALCVSDNYFKSRWGGIGERRLKNCIAFIEWTGAAPVGAEAAAGVVPDPPATEEELALPGPARGRFYAAVSLAEAETLRWMIHHRPACAASLAFAVRLVSSGAYVDRTPLLALVPATTVDASAADAAVEGALPAATWRLPPRPPADAATLWYRFLNCDMFYSDSELATLERGVLSAVPLGDRLGFFSECLRLRRRHRNQWEDAPIGRLFTPREEWHRLRAVALLKRLGDALAAGAAAGGQRARGTLRLRPFAPAFIAAARAAAASAEAEGTAIAAPSAASAGLEGEADESDAADPSLPVEEAASLLAATRRLTFSPGDVLTAVRHVDAAGTGYVSLAQLGSVFPSLLDAAAADAIDAAGGADNDNDNDNDNDEFPREDSDAQWACQACTSRNAPDDRACGICGTPRDGGSASGAPWACPQCTYSNPRSSPACEMCSYSGPESGGGGGGGYAVPCPEGHWSCAPEAGGCSKFNANALFYCEVCDRARPDLAAMRF